MEAEPEELESRPRSERKEIINTKTPERKETNRLN